MNRKLMNMIIAFSLMAVTFGNHMLTVQAFNPSYSDLADSDCDVSKNGVIDLKDLALVAQNYNINHSKSSWKENYDLKEDGIIDIFDLVLISKKLDKDIITAIPTDVPKSTWLWKSNASISSDASENEAYITKTINNLVKMDIDTVYLAIDWDTAANKLTIVSKSNFYAAFLEKAAENNIKVEALLSNQDWALEDKHEELMTAVSEVINFNNSTENKFSGIHLDIEPHVDINPNLPDDKKAEVYKAWKLDPNGVLKQYSNNLKNLKNYMDSLNLSYPLELVLDIPFWYNALSSTEHYYIDGENVVEVLLGIADRLVIMNYTKNIDYYKDWASKTLEFTADKGNRRIIIASELQDPAKFGYVSEVTLYDKEMKDFIEYMSEAVDSNNLHNSFGGIGIHDYDSYIELLNKNGIVLSN